MIILLVEKVFIITKTEEIMVLTKELGQKRLDLLESLTGKAFTDSVFGKVTCKLEKDNTWGDRYVLTIGNNKGFVKFKKESAYRHDTLGSVASYKNIDCEDITDYMQAFFARYEQAKLAEKTNKNNNLRGKK